MGGSGGCSASAWSDGGWHRRHRCSCSLPPSPGTWDVPSCSTLLPTSISHGASRHRSPSPPPSHVQPCAPLPWPARPGTCPQAVCSVPALRAAPRPAPGCAAPPPAAQPRRCLAATRGPAGRVAAVQHTEGGCARRSTGELQGCAVHDDMPPQHVLAEAKPYRPSQHATAQQAPLCASRGAAPRPLQLGWLAAPGS